MFACRNLSRRWAHATLTQHTLRPKSCAARSRHQVSLFSSSSSSSGSGFGGILTRFLSVVGAVVAGSAGYAVASAKEDEPLSWFRLASPILRSVVPPEEGHVWAIKALSLEKSTRNLLMLVNDKVNDEQMLETKVWDISFPNPIGMAAGFDKNAEAVEGIMHLLLTYFSKSEYRCLRNSRYGFWLYGNWQCDTQSSGIWIQIVSISYWSVDSIIAMCCLARKCETSGIPAHRG